MTTRILCSLIVFAAACAPACADTGYDVRSGGFNREDVKGGFFSPDAGRPAGSPSEETGVEENPYSDFAQRERTQPEPTPGPNPDTEPQTEDHFEVRR
jgi:hypothetical protein